MTISQKFTLMALLNIGLNLLFQFNDTIHPVWAFLAGQLWMGFYFEIFKNKQTK